MASRRGADRRYLLLAFLIALMLWGVAHGVSEVERGFDVPVSFQNVPEDLVITDKNSDVVNVRVLGSRAALRNFDAALVEYRVDLSGVQSGSTDFEVDPTRIDVPRGANIVSRSPSRLEVKLERRGTKVMPVRADVTGEPATGYRIAGVQVEPPRVRVAGPRREVLALEEAVTEAIDVDGQNAPVEREVRLVVGGENVWVEDTQNVRVRVQIELVPPPKPAKREAKRKG